MRRKPFEILLWDGNVVSESTVRTQLHELRQVLGEGVIETVVGRGYRFIAEIGEATRAAPKDERIVVGRAAELAILRCFDRAAAGQRQIAFVTGEPGIGKTTRGRVEQHGTPGPYLSIIELLGRLRQSAHAKQTLDALVHYAPMVRAKYLKRGSLGADSTRIGHGGP